MSKTNRPHEAKNHPSQGPKTCINPYPSTFSPPPQQELADEPIAVGVGRPQASWIISSNGGLVEMVSLVAHDVGLQKLQKGKTTVGVVNRGS
ncbi:hypothetical protein CKAN_00372700 [Cinnamomum micranthum f. kanehirae]|uniref:Uncharacterized protein n=1 Tax=Cinnamomum micranthum f. kanehirae TaxID=337451 RepID=A0A3S3M1G0_9MAGN|nr:hypothetical protein CKAN_00372700 [Cinnamomum micranthum f. kanehirae]